MQIVKEILDPSGGCLSRLTVSELNDFTEKQLSDIGPPRLIVCDRYPDGELLAVMISFEDYKTLTRAIECATRAANALMEEFDDRH